MTYFHGGVAGLGPGDTIRPAPPHVTDGCPICVARSAGRSLTAGEYRTWLTGLRAGAPAHAVATLDSALATLDGAPDDAPIDGATGRPDRIYVTTEVDYARWHAARSGHGDLYVVRPAPPVEASDEDPGWPTFVAPSATVVRVVARRVRLDRRDRRALMREWERRTRPRS